MAGAGENSHGCENNSDLEEDRCSENDFGTSELGTKEYWEETYQKELETFKDIGDVGEIWFGEESMSRVLQWMDEAKINENAAILDIGTGNGAFLVELAKHGYKNLTDLPLTGLGRNTRMLSVKSIQDHNARNTPAAKRITPEICVLPVAPLFTSGKNFR